MTETLDLLLTASTSYSITTPRRPLSETFEMTKSQKQVRFSNTATVRFFDPLPVLKRKADIWYNQEEIGRQLNQDVDVVERIRQRAMDSSIAPERLVEAVKAVAAAKSLSYPAWWDIRGLESLLDDGEQKDRKRLQAALTVLMEQDRQDMEDGEVDEHAIAMKYQQITESCQKSARQRAEQDRADVEESVSSNIKNGSKSPMAQSHRCIVDAPSSFLKSIPSRAA